MRNGSGGGTAASEGVHLLQVRLVMGGFTGGGTEASEGGTVLFWLLVKPQYLHTITTPRTPNVVSGLGDSFGGGLGQNYFTQLTTNFFAPTKIQSV